MKERKTVISIGLCLAGFILLLILIMLLVSDGKELSGPRNRYFQGLGGSPFTLEIRPYGTGIAAALLAAMGVFLAGRKFCGKACLFAVLCPLLSLVLSRMLYVLVGAAFYFQYAGVTAALRIDEGGMSLTGALLGAFLAEKLLFGKEKAPMRDLALAMAVFVLAARIAETFSGNGLGLGRELETEAEGLFSVQGDWSCLLRVYAIEALTAAAILTVLVCLSRFGRRITGPDMFRVYLLLFGITQVMMESLRGDHHMEWGFVKAQMIFDFLPAMAVVILHSPGVKGKLLSAGISVLYAGGVFWLEKARDRGWIPTEEGVYALFALATALYLLYALFRVLKTSLAAR